MTDSVQRYFQVSVRRHEVQSCRKTKGIGIWKLPAPRNETYKKWRLDWLNQLTISREIDKNFQRLIDNDRVYTCEKHFKPSYFERNLFVCPVTTKGFKCDTDCPHRLLSISISFLSFAVHNEKMTLKKPKFGAHPTINMPQKSITARPVIKSLCCSQNSKL